MRKEIKDLMTNDFKEVLGLPEEDLENPQENIRKLKELLVKLKGYAEHDLDCRMNQLPTSFHCSCGLKAILRRIEGGY